MKSPHHQMIECQREAEVLDALASGRWPSRADAELTAHVESCAVCHDVIAVASAMQEDHDAAWREANVPSSGQMWWRAEMRARQDAVREASRPVTVAQGVAATLALAVAAIAVWFAWPTVTGAVVSAFPVSATGAITVSPMIVTLGLAMGALLVVAPVALYLVISEKP